MKKIKNILRAFKLLHKRILYKIARARAKVDERVVFFESFQGRSYSCSPKAIFEEMRDSGEYSDYEFIWGFRDVKGRSIKKTIKKLTNNGATDAKVSVYKYESYAYYKALARAKYWIMNSNVRPFLKPRKEQVYVQTWHGTPLKKIGLDVEGSELDYGKESKKFSYMISPSQYCSERLVSAFGLEGREDIILETGYPRNDALFDFDEDKVESIKDKLKIPSDKKVLLYAPTFRDNEISQISGYSNASGLDFESLKKEIGDKYIVLFRAHYFVAKQMDLENVKGFVYDVSDYEDVNDLYIVSDLLVTDYSSVFFDYANLKRPIIFYMYDYSEYKKNARDFYLDEIDLPGDIATTQDALVEAINKSEAFVINEKYKFFNNKFNYLDGKGRGLEVARRIIEN